MSLRAGATGAALGASAGTVSTLLLLNRYLQKELRPPILHHKTPENESEEQILLRVQLLLRDYWPHPLLDFSGYISTAWSGFWASLPVASPGKVETIILNDGGTVSLHWAEPPVAPTRCVVLVLPGLNNDSNTSFVQASMRHFREQGFQAVALNYRGVGGLELTSSRVGCADSWQDLPEVVAHIESTVPNAHLFAVGFSMGACMLLKHLSQEGARSRFTAAVSIAGTVDMVKAMKVLDSNPRKRFMQFMMATGIKMLTLPKLRRSPFLSHLDFGRLWRALSVRDFDAASICVLHGYKDTDDYYEQCSARSRVSQIATPTLILNAKDDPVLSVTSLPLDELKANPKIFVALTQRGGHIGWGSGGLGVASWTDSMASCFMQACEARAAPNGAVTWSRL